MTCLYIVFLIISQVDNKECVTTVPVCPRNVSATMRIIKIMNSPLMFFDIMNLDNAFSNIIREIIKKITLYFFT